MDTRMLENEAINVDMSIFPFSSINIFLTYFTALLFGTFRIAKSS